MTDLETFVVCRNYTHARRFPKMLGRVVGYTLPFLLSMTQVGVLLGSFLLLSVTFGAWSPFVPHASGVLIAVPIALAWAVRHVKVDGRAPVKALAGYATLLFAPRGGVVRGRPRFGWSSGRLTASMWFHTARKAASVVPIPDRRPQRVVPAVAPQVAGGGWNALLLEEVA